jgi:hypothetical protein
MSSRVGANRFVVVAAVTSGRRGARQFQDVCRRDGSSYNGKTEYKNFAAQKRKAINLMA